MSFELRSFNSAEEMMEFMDREAKRVRDRKPTPLEAYPEGFRPVIESAAIYMKIAYEVNPNGNPKNPKKRRNTATAQLRCLARALNEMGGFELMQAVYAAIEDVHPELRYSYGGAMRCLECTWSGIGRWEG